VIKQPPPAGSFKLAAGLGGVHPRLHFAAADLAAIRARGTGGGKFFVDRMKAAYGGYKGKAVTVTGLEDWKNYLYGLWGQLSMSLLWIVEQDQSWADTAKAWALHYVRDSSYCSSADVLDDLVPQEIVTGIALTYDILYAQFTNAERAEIRTKLKTLLDTQYPRFFVGSYWANDFQNNHMANRISGLAHAAIAILGDDPAIDVQKHADLAYYAYQQLRAWMPDDGSTHEGPGYWDYGYHWVIRNEQLFEHVTGTTPPATGHDREAPYYRLYLLTPGMLSTFGVGDTGGSGAASNLEAALPATARFKDERLHGFLKEQMQKNSDGFYEHVAWGLLWYDPTVGSQPYASLPFGRVWTDLDMLSVRSGWTADDVGVVFKCGPPGGHLMQKKKLAGATDYINVAHDHPDQNGFLIWAHGKLLAVDDGYPSDPDTKLTASHNTLLIDGVGGPQENTGWYQPFPYDQTAFLKDVVVSGTTAYAGGDASRLYTNGQRFLRHFAFVEGQYVAIIDDLQGKGSGTHSFDWRLHSDGTWTGSGGGPFKVTDGTAGLEVRFLAPAAGALTSSFFAAAGTASPGLSVKTTASATQLLTVLVPQANGAPSFAAAQRPATGGWAISVDLGGKNDLFSAAAGSAPVVVDDLTATGAAVLVRRQAGAVVLVLLARGTALSLAGKPLLVSSAAQDLVWRPSATGGQLEVAPGYRDAGGSVTVQVGGLKANAAYCLAVDGTPAGTVQTDADGVAKHTLLVQQPRLLALVEASRVDAGACPLPPPPDGATAGDAAGRAESGAGDGGRDAGPNGRLQSGCGCTAGSALDASDAATALGGLLLLVALGRGRGRGRARG
jgi:hypothetical protein